MPGSTEANARWNKGLSVTVRVRVTEPTEPFTSKQICWICSPRTEPAEPVAMN